MTRTLSLLTAGCCILWALYISFFAIVDSDLWWHLAAGRHMLEIGWLIHTEPFAFTRFGEVYLARHEWLTQIIFTVIHGVFGPTGLVGLRMLCIAGLAGLLLSIDWRRACPNGLLIMIALIGIRQGFVLRPQLFSNMCFLVVLVSLSRWMDSEDWLERKRLWWIMAISTVFWVNAHGSAALLAIALSGAVLTAYCWYAGGIRKPLKNQPDVQGTALLVLSLVACQLGAPEAWHNFEYLALLMTDKTTSLIQEWNPTPLPQYLGQFGWLWALVATTVIWTRHRVLPSVLILLGIGLLSRTGSRHNVLFALTALSLSLWQLKHNPVWQQWLSIGLRKAPVALGALAVGLLAAWHINAPYQAFLERSNLVHAGAFSPANGAERFISSQPIQRNLFNTYSIGGYLEFKGHPVFMDGRNLDYGYDLMFTALSARYSKADFDQLVEQYDLGGAIIEYESSIEPYEPFIFHFLNQDPTWALVYFDDWSAVYLKRNGPNDAIIAEHEYRFITPEMVYRGIALDELTADTIEPVEAELKRVHETSDTSINSLIALAKIYRGLGAFDQAIRLADEAIERSPYRYEPYEIMASIAAARKENTAALELYKKVIQLTKHLPVEINQDILDRLR